MLERRAFLAALAAAPVAVAALPAGARLQAGGGFSPGPGPYGSIEGREPDELGLILPEGFTARLVAVAGQPIADTDLVMRNWLDGGDVLALDDGWIHVRNHELLNGAGGVTAIRFDDEGAVVDARSILEGTTRNCAGGITPWGTWLSAEEYDRGVVWECDPLGERAAVRLDALGTYSHEAAAVDPVRGHVYLTEDQPDGRFYRFTPEGDPEDLTVGLLEAAVVAGDGAVTWQEVPDPAGDPIPTRQQVGASMPFNGGEGIWYDAPTDRFLFTTKGDDRVWIFDPAGERIDVLYDASTLGADAPLTGVDNITVSASGDVYVAEDGGDMELVMLTPEGEVTPFLKMTAPEDQSEVTGPAFSPDGTRLLVASYGGLEPNANANGRLFEISGPFRSAEGGASTTTTLGQVAGESGDGDDDDDTTLLPALAGVTVAAAALGGVAVALRRRTGS